MKAAPEYTHGIQVGPFAQDAAASYTLLDDPNARKVYTVACAADGNVYAGSAAGLFRFDPARQRWNPVADFPASDQEVRWLRPDLEGGLWLGTVQKVCHLPAKALSRPDKILEISALAALPLPEKPGQALLLTQHELLFSDGGTKILLPEGAQGRAMARLSDGTPVVATDRGLYRVQGQSLQPISAEGPHRNLPGKLLDPNIAALAADAHTGLWAATPRGLNYQVAGSWLEFIGKDGLPILDTRHLALAPDGTLWIGTERGVIRLAGGKWRYYAGKRWLPDDHVNAIAADKDGNAWVATDNGVAQIAFRPMTLSQKAAHYEEITAARHNRDGYVTGCGLTRPGDLSSFLFHASDNDGLWTALYIGAESFRYGATKDPKARALARKSMNALLDLVRVTGIPGFPARAIIRKGERVAQSDPGPNWYPSPVDPNVTFKDDTSSDEIDGHFFAWYIYSELVADADEKKRIADTCRAVMDHILDHNYTLVGPTGKRTRWGNWHPDSINNDPEWREERGLNSLEILAYLKVAIHLCGDQRFHDAYRTLIEKHHYALNTVTQKVLPPDGENNHSDDELAACAYYPLLTLETDPHLRSLYLLSLEKTQCVLRPENSPFHNVLYGACTGKPCDAEIAAQWLRDAPLDQRDWAVKNTHRADVTLDPAMDRFQRPQLTRALPPNEARVAKWNHNPYEPDSGGNGGSEEDGAFWLLPYWMARYHRIFKE